MPARVPGCALVLGVLEPTRACMPRARTRRRPCCSRSRTGSQILYSAQQGQGAGDTPCRLDILCRRTAPYTPACARPASSARRVLAVAIAVVHGTAPGALLQCAHNPFSAAAGAAGEALEVGGLAGQLLARTIDSHRPVRSVM